MENTNQVERPETNSTLWVVVAVIVVLIISGTYFYLSANQSQEEVKPQVIAEPIVKPIEETIAEPESEPTIAVEPAIEVPEQPTEEIVEIPKPILPSLDESDSWLKAQLSTLTWRKELLRLVIDEDMVRRLVVFTDNFAQGNLAYEYSPLTKPATKFSAIAIDGIKGQWNWDDAQARRFSLYVDFLRSFEPEKLAAWYVELKPLINEAYAELGYPEQDFSETLQDAIVRVLDMELPKEDIKLTRPSVMYKFENPDLEQLPEAEKLLLRMGKDNLLIIKSFLLEFSDALSRAENN